MTQRLRAGMGAVAVAAILGTFVTAGCTPVSTSERTVTVTGGFGSGSYRPGSTVHVWSAVSTTRGVAQRWSGDEELLAEPDEWHTSFVMPDRDVVLVANRTAQTLSLTVETSTGVTTTPKAVRYPPSPLYDERFVRVGGVDRATSAAMAAEVRAAGVVDEAGFITVDGDEIAARVLRNPGAFPTLSSHPNAKAVLSQIKTMRAEHSMYADLTRRNITFFDRFNPNRTR